MARYIKQNVESDGIDRRGFLECMAWAGTTVAYSAPSPGPTKVTEGQLRSLLGSTQVHYVPGKRYLADEKFTHTFRQPGEHAYYCSIHPKMTGKMIVTNPSERT